jgi:carboxylesterase
MLTPFLVSPLLARDDGKRLKGHTGAPALRSGAPTAHARAANALFERAGWVQADTASEQRRHRSRLTSLHMQGGKHGILLFHGLSSTPAELNYLARGLNRAGYTVRVPLVEGYSHGVAAREAKGYREWVAAALAAFDSMRSSCSTVAVGGLCIGSLLALSVAVARPTMTSATLGLSTTLHYDGWANPWTRHLLPVVRYLPMAGRMRIREREPFGVKDERLRGWIATQMRESGASDAGASQLRVRDLIQAQSLARAVKRSLHAVKAPTLMIHAKEDESASPRSSFEVAKGVGSKHVKLVLLADSYHMISIDRERARVLAEMKGFLGEHLGHEETNDGTSNSSRRVGHETTASTFTQAASETCLA